MWAINTAGVQERERRLQPEGDMTFSLQSWDLGNGWFAIKRAKGVHHLARNTV
jgi:hypothetical protein